MKLVLEGGRAGFSFIDRQPTAFRLQFVAFVHYVRCGYISKQQLRPDNRPRPHRWTWITLRAEKISMCTCMCKCVWVYMCVCVFPYSRMCMCAYPSMWLLYTSTTCSYIYIAQIVSMRPCTFGCGFSRKLYIRVFQPWKKLLKAKCV